MSACPVGAIVPDARLEPRQVPFVALNADFYRTPRERPLLAPVVPAPAANRGSFAVAIVGSGPAAMYAADELLTQPDARVTMFERLDRPYGLARFGVAPDHVATRRVAELFDRIAAHPRFALRTGVEVGRDITHDELRAGHCAVIYAVGASADRRLGIEGETLGGCVPARDFVAWYNGHPDAAGATYDLSANRAVIVGNGNVALDVARILAVDPSALAGTAIAPEALAALRESRVDEIVLLARRGPEHSAFTVPEFLGLLATTGIQVVVDAPTGIPAPGVAADFATGPKLRLLHDLPRATTPRDGRRRVVLRYEAPPQRILGDTTVTGIVAGGERIDAGLVLTAIGYRGRPIAGLPFEEATGTVPNEQGRVDPGTYVAGWIKRGPSGFIGTNKSCAQQTVRSLVADLNAGLLGPATPNRSLRPAG